MAIDYTDRSQRRKCQKRWEVIQRLNEYLPVIDQVPVKKLTVGIVVDVDELKVVLEYLKKQGCYAQHKINNGVVYFLKKNLTGIQREYKITKRQYTHFSMVHELNKKNNDEPQAKLEFIVGTHIKKDVNWVYFKINDKKILVAKANSQKGKLVMQLETYTKSLDAIYPAIVDRGKRGSREEQYKHLREIFKEIQRKLSPKGYTASLKQTNQYRNIRIEMSHKVVKVK